MPTRRTIAKWLGLSGALMSTSLPSLSLARLTTVKRLIVIVQRGAQDGLHAVAPYADGEYKRLRPRLALPAPGAAGGVLDLDGYFGLHPALQTLEQLYRKGELAVVPAVATRYRDRSHFDGQNLLENGTNKPFGADDGWLNRALAGLETADGKSGFAFGLTTPLIMRGAVPVRVYAPSTFPGMDEDFLERLQRSYTDDAALSAALAEALEPVGMQPMSARDTRRASRGDNLVLAARTAADAMLAQEGARVAVIESNGWDTHNNQTGRLTALFTELDNAMGEFRTRLAPVWQNTVIVTVSEFGRTAAENGSGGTDHGTGGVSFVAGGTVAGGRILGKWPGLSGAALYQQRDVAPANALESVLTSLLVEHLGLAPQYVASKVFPGDDDIWPMMGVLRG